MIPSIVRALKFKTLSFAPLPVHADRVGGSARLLPLAMEGQQQSNWCWSAVATSIGNFLHTGKWTQCGTAAGCLNLACCNDPSPCNVYGYLEKSLSYTLSLNQMFWGTTSAAALEAEINAAQPVGVRVAWSAGGAHFLAVIGYDSTGSIYRITVADSIYGVSVVALDQFASAYQGGGTWTHTYLTRSNP